MLSILPYERSSGQRDTTERPFKSYPRAPPSLYTPFSQTSSLSLTGSYNAAKVSSDYRSTTNSMDVRTHSTHGVDPYSSHNSLIDMSHGGVRGMSYKQEAGLYPSMHNGLGGPGGYPSHPYMHHNQHTGTGMLDPTLPELSSANNTPTQADMMNGKHHMHTSGMFQNPSMGTGNTVSSTTNAGLNSPDTPKLNSPTSNQNMPTIDQSTVPSPPIRAPPKKRPLNIPDNLKDDGYWDKRKKNNDSAKRSRDGRRMKEEQIAMRVVYLEQENLQLRTESSLLKNEIEKLRCMLYS